MCRCIQQLGLVLGIVILLYPASARSAEAGHGLDLSGMSLEQLLNVETDLTIMAGPAGQTSASMIATRTCATTDGTRAPGASDAVDDDAERDGDAAMHVTPDPHRNAAGHPDTEGEPGLPGDNEVAAPRQRESIDAAIVKEADDGDAVTDRPEDTAGVSGDEALGLTVDHAK